MKNERIRVLFLVPKCGAAGPLFVLHDILRSCDPSEFSFSLISMAEEDPKRTILPEFSALMTCRLVPTAKHDALLGRADAVRSAMDELHPDVIHSTGLIPDLLVSRWYPEKQLVILHSDFRTDYAYTYGKLPGCALARLHLNAVRRAGTAVAVSENLSKIYRDAYHFEVPFIRNGVAIRPAGGEDKAAIRQKLQLPEDRRIFVCAATFKRLKNQEFLIRAFERLGNAPLLLLLGDGPLYRDLKGRYPNLKNTRMEGRVSNVREYLRASDYYVSASRTEGISLGVLEGMSEGLPPLLSDIDSHQEILGLSGGSGELFRLDDQDSFSEAMKRILRQDYRCASYTSRETVRRHFDAVIMSRAYQDRYRSIARKSKHINI